MARLALVPGSGLRPRWRSLLRENSARVIASGGQIAAACELLRELDCRDYPELDELEAEIIKILDEAGERHRSFEAFIAESC